MKETKKENVIAIGNAVGTIGKQIKNVKQIMEMADKGKSIYVKPYNRAVSAAFIQNWHFRIVMKQLAAGYYFTYKAAK